MEGMVDYQGEGNGEGERFFLLCCLVRNFSIISLVYERSKLGCSPIKQP